ncbi:hypothetical protein HDV01_005111 [Terramyces sp. JEL0728]|nr:hypothetical protein HDV01_005111 [Terramyces sp. JEL0728]
METSCITEQEKSNITDPNVLSALLYRPCTCSLVVKEYLQIIPDLISRNQVVSCKTHQMKPELMELITFSRLVPLLPYLKPFSLKPLVIEPRYVYYLLKHSRDYFSFFSPLDFYPYLERDSADIQPDDISIYYAILCIGLLSGMVDTEQQQMIKKCIPDLKPHSYKQSLDLLLLFNYKEKEFDIKSDKVANLCGVLLPKQQQEYKSEFVMTETPKRILHEIGLALSCEMPILLQGEEGSGKTALVEEAGRILGCQELLKIHLGDQTDSKLLLGTYMTTSTPGVFKWQPGILTTAVTEGRWLLIEDIDLAPVDVISILLPLLETRWLHVQSRGERHYAKDGFKIFATKRTENKSIGENLWTAIKVPVMELDEIQQIITAKFPEISQIELIIQVYDKLKTIYKEFQRQLSIRDLIKWCDRISQLLGIQELNELVFREAFDCILGMIPKEQVLFSVALELGNMLELSQHRVEYYIQHHLPSLVVEKDYIQIGRVTLPKIKQIESNAPFASTSASLRLLEKLAMCVLQKEPILLVGETGTGKTTVVQKLASQLGHKLTVINMSQQSDSTDLLGGFKPVDQVMLIAPLKEKFDELFSATFSAKNNTAFIDSINKYYSRKKWDQVLVGFNNAIKMAEKVQANQQSARLSMNESEGKKKARKVLDPSLFVEWEIFQNMTREFQQKMQQIKSNFLFSFVEGSLVQAMKNGHWILLDEINLATAETLECLSGLLQGPDGSILLLERGDVQPIKRHQNFRIFGCMNPANDAGKRNLPGGLRSRFTEFWVNSPDSNITDLLLVIKSYIYKFLPAGPSGEEICRDIAQFYVGCKSLAVEGMVFDGADQKVHISMRTLTRALSCASFIAPTYGLRRSLYEGCFMTFMTGLSTDSFKKLYAILETCILNTVRNAQAFIKQIPQCPEDNQLNAKYTLVDSFWLEKGPLEIPENLQDQFVLTPSVKANLANLARGCVSRKYPILIQGPTSAGKTSMIEYLAKCTGHRFIRINNHEHTDLQEYLGGYMSNNEGVLVFQEGVLVEALRKGYWIVLDELNLAPSDVLEALNRLLDDNRELFLAEKQEMIKPHPNFMLFATQNPAGQYGGRKQLSRAFRNRFLELHFTDIPEHELETILEKRCRIAPSYAKKCVAVYKQLSQNRDASRIFQGRQSFITLRDLFRWALRNAVGYEALAQDGYMLIAERVRKPEDRQVIQCIIEKELKVKLDMQKYYTDKFSEIITRFTVQPTIVWTRAMKKLFVLIHNSTIFAEPVLLIGETGCGKTTVCQLLASLFGQQLHIVNAHQNSETSDFLGSQRPARNRDQYEAQLRQALVPFNADENLTLGQLEEFVASLKAQNTDVGELEGLITKAKALFEWHDGPLVQAMQQGDMFLLDEISLADDSVLERLNSVLEPSRQLTLVEKNGTDIFEIRAHGKFQFFATMNPGGDYGKKELSPALRNRFTEIWVPQISDKHDLQMIISNKMRIENSEYWAIKILEFLDWYAGELNKAIESIFSLRDVLAWAGFIVNVSPVIGIPEAFYHGGCMVLIDGMGVNPLLGIVGPAKSESMKAREMLLQVANMHNGISDFDNVTIQVSSTNVGVEPFVVPFGNCPPKNVSFTLQAPTTLQNCMRVLRSMQLTKPILLEGSPGAGKTSLITSLAAISRHNLIRINLSEQTDLMDLFGSDLPVEGGSGGEFSWRDGPFLKAMQDGDWVLLDELNLASQQVLEGLNACLDHRATVYIPELDKHFSCHPDFRVFAAQNPQAQGGGRKGLPKSFVNRFTLVYVEELTKEDLIFICKNLYPQLPSATSEKMIEFNEIIKRETMDLHNFGWLGAPWEFNLRDILRWIDLMIKNENYHNPAEYLNILYVQRMRTDEDRESVRKIYHDVFGELPEVVLESPYFKLTDEFLVVGNQVCRRTNNRGTHKHGIPVDGLQVMVSSLPIIHSLLMCIKTRSTALLVGPTACGKSSLVRLLAQFCGEKLEEFSLNPGVDALELLGGFEQVDLTRCEQEILEYFADIVERITRQLLLEQNIRSAIELSHFWVSIENSTDLPRNIGMFAEFLESLKPLMNDDNLYLFLAQKIANFKKLFEGGTGGQFEWMDSTLITALERGYWLLVDNVNLCSSSVLDRLNSLLEVGGSLAVNERGLVNGEVKIITPHPNFRIFMTMDPRHGEISRAMRNRSIEIFISDFYNYSEAGNVDVMKLLTEYGLPGIFAAKSFLDAEKHHLMAKNDVRLAVERLRRGQEWKFLFSSVEISLENSPEEILLGYDSWPLRNSGQLLAQNSTVSNALHKISILANLLISDNVQLLSPNSFENVPSKEYLIEAAYLRKSGIHTLKHATNEAYSDLITQLAVERIVNCNVLEETEIYDRCGETESTLAQLSYMAHFKKIRVSSLPHVSVKYFYPLLESIHDYCLGGDGNSAVGMDLLQIRKELFECLEHTEFKFEMIIVTIDKLYGFLQNTGDLSHVNLENIKNVLLELTSSLSYDKYQSCCTLWNSASNLTFVDENLFALFCQFKTLDFQMSLWEMNPQGMVIFNSDWFVKTADWSKWSKFKVMVIEAVATLHFLNDQVNIEQELLSVLEKVPQSIILPNDDIEELKPDMQLVDSAQKMCTRFMLWPINDLNCIITEMKWLKMLQELLAHETPNLQGLRSLITETLPYMIANTSFTPLHFEPSQRLAWYVDSSNTLKISGDLFVMLDESTKTFLSTTMKEALLQWNKALWANGHTFWNRHLYDESLKSLINGEIAPLIYKEVDINLQDNSSDCLHPIVSSQSGVIFAMTKQMNDVPLYSLESKLEQLLTLQRELSEPCTEMLDILCMDTEIFVSQLMDFFGLFNAALQTPEVARIIQLLSKPYNGAKFQEIAILLANVSLLTDLVKDKMIWIFSHLHLIIEDPKHDEHFTRGMLWTAYSYCYINTYIPDFPMDPVAGRKAKLHFLSKEMDELISSLLIEQEYQFITFGNSNIFDQQTRLGTLHSLQAEQKKLKSRMPLRPEVSQMKDLYLEMQNLKNNVLSDKAVSSLARSLEQPSFADYQKESSLQELLLSIVKRLETRYQHYNDLLYPLILSIYQMKYGLRYLKQKKKNSNKQFVDQILVDQLQFVKLFDTQGIAEKLQTLEKLPTKDAQDMSIKLSAHLAYLNQILSFKATLVDKNADLNLIIHQQFNSIVNLWSFAEEQRLSKLEQDQSLYKARLNEFQTSDEFDDEEFRKLFPDFQQEFADLDVDPNGQDHLPATVAPVIYSVFNEKVNWNICNLFDKLNRSDEQNFETLWKSSYENCFNCAVALAQQYNVVAPPEIDSLCRTGLLYVTKNHIDKIKYPMIQGAGQLYDFYNDPNVHQASKLKPVILSYEAALNKALQQWPAHAVLVNLALICRRILSFPVTSPIMKLLTGLELLLVKSADWENYSSKEYSLKSELMEVTNLIIQWRKLELETWRELLEIENRKCSERASSHWFHLWKIITGLSSHQGDDLSNNEMLNDILQSLDDFLVGSSIGEFKSRMNMVESFRNYLASTEKATPVTTFVKDALHNVHSFYQQFVPSIDHSIEQIRKPILKELREYVKIASWKDINVFALKESATRTHHHLNKFVKKYRLELLMQVKEVIAAYHENMPQLKSIEKIEITVGKLQNNSFLFISNASMKGKLPYFVPVDSRMLQAEKLYLKAKSFGQGLLAQTDYFDTATYLDDFSSAIIERTQEFRDMNSGLSAGSKTAKGQKMIRKKALVDLIKTLNFIGLNPRCSHKYSGHQASEYMYSRPDPEFSTLIGACEKYGIASQVTGLAPVIERANLYYYRNIARLGAVRKQLASHSPDISSMEREYFIGYLDDLLHMSIEHRSVFSNLAEKMSNIIEHLIQLKDMDETKNPSTRDGTSLLKEAINLVSGMYTLIVQTSSALGTLSNVDSEVSTAFGNLHIESHNLLNNLKTFSYFVIQEETKSLATQKVNSIIADVNCLQKKCLDTVDIITMKYPALDFICSALKTYLHQSQAIFVAEEAVAEESLGGCLNTLDACLDNTLLVIQKLQYRTEIKETNQDENDFGWKSKQLYNSNIQLVSSTPIASFDHLYANIRRGFAMWSSFLSSKTASTDDKCILQNSLQRLYPIVHQSILMIFYRLHELVLFHKSLAKFQYILSNTFYSLLKDGFCIPKLEENDEDEGDMQDNVDGMGIGEGEGKKDVSDEIENEDQVEGLKNDADKAPPADKNEMKEEDDAIEMENDFDGVLEDVSEDENQDQQEEEDEKEEHDEQMGNLDDDLADVVDEKMWGDEDQDQQNGKDEKTERDSSLENPAGELETAAQENATEDNPSKEEQKDAKKEPEPPNALDNKGEDEEGKINKDTIDNFEENHGIDVKEENGLDDKNEEDMELPEDLDLDGDDDGIEDLPDNENIGESTEEPEQTGEMDLDDANQEPPTQEESHIPDLEELEQIDQPNADEAENPEESGNEEEEHPETEPTHGLGENNPEVDEHQDQEGEVQGAEAQEQNKAESNQPFGVEGKGGDRSVQDENQNAGNSTEPQDSAEDMNMEDTQGEKTNKNTSKAEGKNSLQDKDRSSQPNPHRSVGDAMEKWLSRLRDIADSVNEKSPDSGDKNEQEVNVENADFEYVKEDDKDQGDHQALGVADQDQLEKMDKQALGEEGDNTDGVQDDSSMDLNDLDKDKSPGEPTATIEPIERNENKGVGGQLKSKVEDDDEMDIDKDDIAEPSNEEIDEIESTFKATKIDDQLGDDTDRVMEMGSDESVLDYDQLRLMLEQKMSEWRKSGQDPLIAKDLWKNYTTLTRDLSFLLCEQLRLILEPTLSTKLKGDYRTGKRLNMRKIISYIASQFKKDKIWLRRTKPSKRTYQIMIAIDDSLSMSSTHSVQLAYESLTLITNALSQLEVGEIAVVGFGEQVSLLHPFEKTWSDEAGAQVLQSFTFKQEKTKVKLLMEQSLEILKHSRQLSQTSDLWQLQLVLSDGLCDDHEYIKAKVRAAAEERIAMVFIMLDTRPEKDSILNMSSVSYDFDAATNKPILKVERYMDTFPFDYYVVVRNIEKLPEILSDTLRQFFMFINQ